MVICPHCECPEDAGADLVDQHMRQRVTKAGRPLRVDPTCPKCSGQMSVRGQLRASAGGISAAFELSNARFDAVSCALCGYTEFYRSEVSGLGQLADLFVS
jgi:predicted nucleic-acid-binding Zn-ribbon protein